MKRYTGLVRIVAAVVLVLSALLSYGQPLVEAAGGQETNFPFPSLPPKGGNPKLDCELNRLVSAHTNNVTTGPARANTVQGLTSTVRVIIETSAKETSQVKQTAANLGTVEANYGSLVQVSVPVGQLSALADMTGVRFVRMPYQPVEDVVSEGVALINADDWQNAGYNGSGVKIGVVDGGFSGYTTRQVEGELPASITTNWAPSLGGPGSSIHGTACAEIIYDVAPGAQFYLANINTEVEFGNAVNWMIAQGVNIISHSMGWLNTGPGNGTGPINDIVTTARAAGILWVNSAGNSAQKHWSGTFNDQNPGDAYNWHYYTPTDISNSIYAYVDNTIIVGLKWDDPWTTSNNDYDLYLGSQATSTIVAGSENEQNGNDYPEESFSYVVPTTGWYDILIWKYSATRNVFFHLLSFTDTLQYQVASGSLTEPADSPNTMTVGAVFWNNTGAIEPFSSQGPTTDGRIKPDITALDGVSTRTYGASNGLAWTSSGTGFFGTSASAPHAAGAAALVKQRNSAYTPAQIQAFLEGRAVDLGSVGKDNIFGSGRLDLGTIPPSVITNTSDNITQTSARLNGEVTSTGGENPTVHIYWGPSDGGTTPGSWAHDINLGVKPAGTFFTNISSLTAGTSYHYRCYTVNSGGGSWAASTASFTTSPNIPALANSSGTSNITTTSARLNGQLTSTGGENPTVHFYWGPSDGSTTPGSWAHDVNLGVKAAGTFYTDISGLTAATPYYYRSYAVNSGGGGWAASTASFTTSPTAPPMVISNNADNITTTSARLKGNLSSLGTAPSANVSFEWGTTSGNLTQQTIHQVMASTGNFSANIADLSPCTNYYFRAKASSDNGTVYGSELKLTTLAIPITLLTPALGTGNISTRPTFTWTAYTGALWYEIVLSEDPNFTIPAWSHNTYSLLYNVEEPLKYGTTYYWRVRGVTGEPYIRDSVVITPAGPWTTGNFNTKTLVSIVIAPDYPILLSGRTQQFTAICTSADNTTDNLTTSVTWSSSNTSVAIINSSGLAIALVAGNTTIRATLGEISDITSLTVVVSVEVNSGETLTLALNDRRGNIPLAIKGIPNSGNGTNIGVFTFNLNWNKDVIHIDNVTAASIVGFSILAGTANNTNGSVTITGSASPTYLTGNVTIAYFSISAVGSTGNSTSITVAITDLSDQNANPVSATAVNATAKIVNLVAETSLAQGLVAGNIIAVKVNIDRIKDPSDNSTAQIPGGIGSYTATANASAASGIQFVTVNGVIPFESPNFNVTSGVFSVAVVSSPPQANNTTVAKVILILTGNVTTSGSLTISFSAIGAASAPGLNVPEEFPNTVTFQRGDVDKNGVVSVVDSLAIKQYLVGQLTLSQINPLNASTPNHDGAGGDKISVVDALAIEQYLVGQRNACFQ